MKILMKSAVMMVLILGISSGAVWGDVTTVATYDGIIDHNPGGTYYGVITCVTSPAVNQRAVGVNRRATDGVIFEHRAVFKWDMSGITEHVSSAAVNSYISWTELTGSLAGNIMLSTFTTSSNGDVVSTDGGWEGASPSADSEVAYASTTTGAVSMDVTDWFNAAIDNHLSYFCVRLSADYLFPINTEVMALGNHVSYGLGNGWTTLTTGDVVPEPAALLLLGLGTLAAIPRRRRPVS